MKKIVLAALIALLVLTGCGEKALDTDLNEDKNTVLSDEEIHNKEDGKITENTSVRSKPNLPKPVEPGLIHGNYFSKQQVIVDRDNPISVDSIPIKTVGAFADDDLLIDECAEEDDFFSAYGSEDGVELTVQLSKDYTKKLIIVDNEIYYASSVDVGTVRVIDKMTGELKGEYIFGDLNIEDMCVLDKCHFLCLACGDIYLADMESLTAKNLTNLGNVDFYSPSADKVTYFVTYGDNRSEETLSSNYEIMDIIAKEGRFIGNGTDSEVYYYLNRFIKNDGFEFYVRDEGIYRRGIIVKDYATNLNRSGDMLFYTPVNNKMMVKSINI